MACPRSRSARPRARPRRANLSGKVGHPAAEHDESAAVGAAEESGVAREDLQGVRGARPAAGADSDNTAIIAKIVRLRAERAALLGYPNHAAYQLADESAATPAAVQQILTQLAPVALSRATARCRRDAEDDRRRGGAQPPAVVQVAAVGLGVLRREAAQGAL